jgi:triosephosphate isomerase (TIM)
MLLVINFKTYEEGTGKNAEELAKKIESVKGSGEIILAVQNSDLYRISKVCGLKLFGQHVDPAGFGSNTGKDTPEALKENMASGVLINHSEDRIDLDTIRKNIERCKSLGIVTIVCAETPEVAENVASFGPDYVAIEPPELIGSGVSVSSAKPEIVVDTVKKIKKYNIPVLCGAGITKGEDIKKAIELGCKGVLVASGVVKSEDAGYVVKKFLDASVIS